MNRIDSYQIMEYNVKTMKYTVLGFADGNSPQEAKENFVKSNNFKARTGTILFVKSPVCR